MNWVPLSSTEKLLQNAVTYCTFYLSSHQHIDMVFTCPSRCVWRSLNYLFFLFCFAFFFVNTITDQYPFDEPLSSICYALNFTVKSLMYWRQTPVLDDFESFCFQKGKACVKFEQKHWCPSTTTLIYVCKSNFYMEKSKQLIIISSNFLWKSWHNLFNERWSNFLYLWNWT